jgi:YfiH family protein
MSRTLFTSRDGGDLKEDQKREELRNLLSLEVLHFMKQSHGDLVMVVVAGDERVEALDCDALVTTSRGIGLAALAADCMPITFSAGGVVAVAHIGRVGLLKGLASKTVAKMREHGAVEIQAVIGPSICGNCYEVSPEMYREVISRMPACATTDERHTLDLQAGVMAELRTVGVVSHDVGICTLENPKYFSYRGGDLTQRQAGVISL